MRIYALCDRESLDKFSISIEKFVKAVENIGSDIIQYRNKKGALEEIKRDLIEIRKFWKKTIILNDHLKFLNLVDGFHIGQEDLERFKSVDEVRKIIGNKILGLSTHNKNEILEANSLDLDYIGLGAYRGTSTKNVSTILGSEVEELAKISKHKVAIIGGVKLEDKFENGYWKVIGSDILLTISKVKS